MIRSSQNKVKRIKVRVATPPVERLVRFGQHSSFPRPVNSKLFNGNRLNEESTFELPAFVRVNVFDERHFKITNTSSHLDCCPRGEQE